MVKIHTVTRTIIIAHALIAASTLNPAWSQQKTLDPSGYILKYDTSFNAIGPHVYVLPAPRTKEEEIRDNYVEIAKFQDSISQGLRYQRLLAAWKSTSNHVELLQLLTPLPKNTSDWNTLISNYSEQQNPSIVYGLLNEYAKMRILNKETMQATGLLESALQQAMDQKNNPDIGIIQSNLSSLLLYNKDYIGAGAHEEAYYKLALQNKSIAEQANSLVKIALIQAYDKDFRSAENNIIRKAIPLYNKSKEYEGKTNAWITLAEIYQLQNKHTEAQWFLIQARDLAKNKNFTNNLAEIEYMLGLSKYIQRNLVISKNELNTAFELAQKENNKYLQLAIVEKIGLISIEQNKINDAEKQLKDYWRIRKELF